MGLLEICTLFAVMAALAIVPSTSVALVVSRSATAGFTNGAAVVVGIVLGDLILATLAILGTKALSAALGDLFLFLKYVAGAYLIWFGISLLTSGTTKPMETSRRPASTLLTSFLSGFTITLGDIKALFFYASLFPAFVDPTTLQALDVAIIMALTIITVGMIKLGYAYAAQQLLSGTRKFKPGKATKLGASGLMIALGARLLTQ